MKQRVRSQRDNRVACVGTEAADCQVSVKRLSGGHFLYVPLVFSKAANQL